MTPALTSLFDARLLVLSAGDLRVLLAPDAGGSIAAFTRVWLEGSRRRELHWLRAATATGLAARDPLRMASFPLVPFCNRIRDGRATFEGRGIAMPRNHPGDAAGHPLHGIGWLRQWQVRSVTRDSAHLALEVEHSDAWPWRFSAWQRFELDERRLAVTIGVRNDDTADMPAGIGHHPYFPHHPGTVVTTRTRAMWATDAEVMPVALDAGGPVDRLREGVELARLDLDNNFIGWERGAEVQWPADVHGPARSLVMEAQSPLDYFVLYSPRGLDHFCAEPVSQCTDWINLLDRHEHGLIGGARLAPGQSLAASFTLSAHWG